MIVGILIGGAGVAAVLTAGWVLAVRPIPRDTAPRPGRQRLDLARAQLVETLGPLGAFVMLLGGGVFVVTAVAALFGIGVAALEHPVDWWAFRLADRVRSNGWAHVMGVVTQMGNSPAVRVTGAVSSVALAFATRGRRWAPAVLILSVIVVEKYQQSLLGTIVDRGHPPTTLGTYPSGGCARLISVYGIILFLTLELSRAGRRTRTAAWTVLGAAAFVEGYSRWYLNKHWLTDILGGWYYGGLLLAVSIFAGRALAISGSMPDPVALPIRRPDTISGGS